MTYINMSVSCVLPKEKEESIKADLGRFIYKIPDKSEDSLMIKFEDQCHMWMRGSNAKPIAIVDIMLLGGAETEVYCSIAQPIITALGRELAIDPSYIYVKFEEVANWFWGLFSTCIFLYACCLCDKRMKNRVEVSCNGKTGLKKILPCRKRQLRFKTIKNLVSIGE